MSNKTIIATALAAVNEDLMKELVCSAKPLIVRIDSFKLGIANNREQIVEIYKKLVALASSKVDDSFLTSVPAGEAKTTVLAVIKKMNEDKQASIEIEAKNLASQIDALQVRIDADEKRMAEVTKALLDLKPRTVSEPLIPA